MAKPGTSAAKAQGSVYQRFEHYLSRKKAFLVLLVLGVVLSVINFNARISEAHDDSLYIEAAYKYVHEFPNYYYTSNAPMYPMVLALLTLVFGTNLIVFKLFSMLFFVAGAVLYYRAVNDRIPGILKYFAFTFLCINHLLLYYSSQTFSETFYMLVQATFFFYFIRYNFGDHPLTGYQLKTEYKKWMVLGLLMMLLTLAKNILLFGIVAIFLYFIFYREYRKALVAMVSFGIFKGLYEIIKSLIWGEAGVQYTSQMGILLNKDPYDASEGQEDIAGFIGRFTDNIELYLGRRFYQVLGLMKEDADPSYLLAFLVLGLTFYGLYRAVKDRQKVIVFLVLFAGTISFGTFLVLQARWDQPRFIMVHMPSLLIGITYGLYRGLQKDSFNQTLFVTLLLILTGSMFTSSFKRGVKNIPIVKKNLQGDIYYGYTPDWQNFLKASAWVRDSLPDTALVASRKAPMSFVYSGRHFFPIYSVIEKDSATNQSQPDSALAFFRRNKVTHVLLASLRLDPRRKTENVINTIHLILAPIARKYPEKLVLVKQFGSEEDEPSAIYELRY